MRQTRSLAIASLLVSAMIAALAACGYSISGSGAPPAHALTPAACASPTTGAAVSRGGSEPRSRAQLAVPVTTLPPGVTVGQVQVVIESGEYGREGTIFAWAGNGLGQCVYATDHQSECSIVVLERRVSGGWQPQAACQLATPTRIVALPPIQAAFIHLAPPAAGAQQATWQAGIYRVAFGYRLNPDGSDQPSEVYSTTFTIS